MIAAGDSRSTIVAIASSTAPAVRGIVRIAGEDAMAVLMAMLMHDSGATLPATIATLVSARRAESLALLQSAKRPCRIDITLDLGETLGLVAAVVLVWPTSQSYTGLPSVEIHTFGAAPILEAIVESAVRAGARPAGPGEFTMRAFLAGRLDLPQAEAVLGVIDATNREQLDAALTQLAGNVSAPLRRVRDDLLDLLADIEAGLDFVEEDIHFIDDESISTRLVAAADVIEQTMRQIASRHRSASTLDVVLRGLPNAGKSSLLNAIVGRNVALVSNIAGTTRDVVGVETSILGHSVRIHDTAGVETVGDEISRQSQQAADDSQRTALLTLMCVDHRKAEAAPSHPGENISGDQSAEGDTANSGRHVLGVATQCDDHGDEDEQTHSKRLESLRSHGWIITSAVTGQGLDELMSRIGGILDAQTRSSELGVSATAARCGDSIRRAAAALQTATEMVHSGSGHEWVAGEIRLALSGIAEVTGEIYTDDILDRVFSRFCIGK